MDSIRIKNRFITSEDLSNIDACKEGLIWFEKNFPAGGKLKSVLEKLQRSRVVEKNGWICWTIGEFAYESHTMRCEDLTCQQCIKKNFGKLEWYE